MTTTHVPLVGNGNEPRGISGSCGADYGNRRCFQTSPVGTPSSLTSFTVFDLSPAKRESVPEFENERGPDVYYDGRTKRLFRK